MKGFWAGAVLGYLVAIAGVSIHDANKIIDCRERHKVYACELQPVPNPIWIKPNAENT